MSDLVQRLRQVHRDAVMVGDHQCILEAADEIERLEKALGEVGHAAHDATKEVMRLRAALARIANAYSLQPFDHSEISNLQTIAREALR